jgi:methylase of polypeptide subunit release factors
MLSGELYAAPVKELERDVNYVLDIGTGTGIWATEFGTSLHLPLIFIS